ncbi:MAG: hypothetical protein HRT77_01585 [Halioglobus sp.]|nr:hypothetical protein [Halioglobus sp.]
MALQPALKRGVLLAALGILFIAYIVNHLLNHTAVGTYSARIPGLYVIVSYLGAGVCLPAMFLRRLPIDTVVFPFVVPRPREVAWIVAAGFLGASVAYFPFIESTQGIRLTGVITLFSGLLVASTAEFLLFIGVVFVVVEQTLLERGKLFVRCVAGIASCITFSLFYLTYPDP